MKPLKIGLIGVGIMGSAHLKKLLDEPELYEVTAVCDIDQEKFKLAQEKQIPCFTDYLELLDSGLCEAVGVVTPHPIHAEISIAAFERGMHVLCEKPLSESISKTDDLLLAAKKAGTVFSTNFSMRTTAINQVIRDWMQQGALGKIIRVDFVCTEWIRSQHYFDMQQWRGTWAGEGGGILMNQAPHNLDLLYWWFGDMASVRAKLGTYHHDIETEDDVEAVFVSRAGFPVRFYANTGEAPGIDRIEIIGDRGTLIREAGKLKFRKLETPVSAMLSGEEAFPAPKVVEEDVPVEEKPRGAEIIWKNFAEAIRGNVSLIAPGVEADRAVEFANGATLSHFTGETVNFPIDRAAYDKLLADLIQRKKGL